MKSHYLVLQVSIKRISKHDCLETSGLMLQTAVCLTICVTRFSKKAKNKTCRTLIGRPFEVSAWDNVKFATHCCSIDLNTWLNTCAHISSLHLQLTYESNSCQKPGVVQMRYNLHLELHTAEPAYSVAK